MEPRCFGHGQQLYLHEIGGHDATIHDPAVAQLPSGVLVLLPLFIGKLGIFCRTARKCLDQTTDAMHRFLAFVAVIKLCRASDWSLGTPWVLSYFVHVYVLLSHRMQTSLADSLRECVER